jgi:hypothetical protein
MNANVTVGIWGALLLAGCSSPSSSPAAAAISPPDGGTVVTTDGGGISAPPNLRQFESNAEGLSDSCKIEPSRGLPNWTQATGLLEQSREIWIGLRSELAANGAPATELTAIDDALSAYGEDVTAQTSRKCETDANTITLVVPDLFDLFAYPAPSDTLRLDGTFRQLQIDGEYSDWTAAAVDLPKVTDVWTRLKPLVAAPALRRPDIQGSTTVVADMGAALGGCSDHITAMSSRGLAARAQDGLDLTDVSEQVFK